MSRAILFGYEGGLIDQAGLRFGVLEAALAEEGITVPADLVDAFPAVRPYEEWLGKVVTRETGKPQSPLVARLLARAAARYRAAFGDRGPNWREGAIRFVESAALLDVALGLIASLRRAELRSALDTVGIAPLFKLLLSSTEGGGSRLEAYRQGLGLLNTEPPLPARLIHPHEVVGVEGTEAGLEAAKAAGLTTLGIGPAVACSALADHHAASFEAVDIDRLFGRGSG